MNKRIYHLAIAIACATLVSCGGGSDKDAKSNDSETENVETEAQEPVSESASETKEDKLGKYKTMVGKWSADAATAGVQIDLTFQEDGTFKQEMGTVNQEGTWEVVDADHIKINTPNLKDGQTWLITGLSDDNVEICWNPDSKDPKTIPMKRVD